MISLRSQESTCQQRARTEPGQQGHARRSAMTRHECFLSAGLRAGILAIADRMAVGSPFGPASLRPISVLPQPGELATLRRKKRDSVGAKGTWMPNCNDVRPLLSKVGCRKTRVAAESACGLSVTCIQSLSWWLEGEGRPDSRAGVHSGCSPPGEMGQAAC